MKIKYNSWIPLNADGRSTDVASEVEARKAAIKVKEEAAMGGRAERLAAHRDGKPPAKSVEELALAASAAKAAAAAEDDKDTDDDSEEKEVKKVIKDDADAKDKDKKETKDDDADEDDESWMDDFSDDDDDADSDKSTDDTKTSDDDDDADEDSEDDQKSGNKEMRKRIEEQSTKRKIAETKNLELETKLEEAEAALKVEQEKSKDLASQSIDWSKHADITPIQNKFDQAVYRGATLIEDGPAQAAFAKDVQGVLLQEYYDATKDAKTVSDKLAADASFRATLEKKYDVDIPAGVVAHVKDAVDLYIEMDDKVADLKDRHANNRLSTGIAEYEAMMQNHTSRINDLGNVDEEFMETNPDSIETIVGLKYRDDADFKKKADKLKRRASEYIYGLKPLTQSQIDNVEKRASSEGLTVQKFMERRQENYEAGRDKFFNDVFYKSMAMEETEEMRKVYKRYLKSKNKSKATREAASKVKTKETTKVKKVEDTKQPAKRGTRKLGLPADYIPVSQRSRK